ncbi:TIGR03089 family protein [Corynebacterium sp. H113]|uniref:TIGR03089 family protein n=1 Tax=Corynebacterium sp. H113 TaxID=3133419 RepID=UPI0030AF696C
MELLKKLLNSDPSIPRLTCYDETTGGRVDLSATTLDNWASKIANMLHDEFDLEAGDPIWIELPPIWSAVCILVGARRAGMHLSPTEPLAVFTTLDRLSEWDEKCPDAYLAAVTDDVFGRGVAECGGSIPPGVIDFGPEVRLHPDQYLGPGLDDMGAELIEGHSVEKLLEMAEQYASDQELPTQARVLTRGWLVDGDRGFNAEAWTQSVLAPWMRDGSAVIVRGGDEDRLRAIAEAEKAVIL